MPKKLNDEQVSKLVIEYANGTSISALAKKYGITRNTVSRYISNEAVFEQKLSTIKKETVTEWLENHKNEITGLLNQIIGELPKKIKDGNLRDLIGAYKILTETSFNLGEKRESSDENEIKINLEIKDLSGGYNNEN